MHAGTAKQGWNHTTSGSQALPDGHQAAAVTHAAAAAAAGLSLRLMQ